MSTSRFAGDSVLVTGGGSGIGRAVALAFAREGAGVTLADVNAEAGSSVAAEIVQAGGAARFVLADATEENDVARLVEQAVLAFGPLTHAVNNVGLSRPGTIESLSREDWDWTVAISLTATWLAMKYEIPVMRARGGGSIVNTASMAGKKVTAAASPAYSAAKAGVIHLSSYAAALHAAEKIRINSVSPGLVATPLIARMLSPEEQARIAAEGQYIARAVDPTEIAGAVLYLSSKEAAMITGTDLEVCGGRR